MLFLRHGNLPLYAALVVGFTALSSLLRTVHAVHHLKRAPAFNPQRRAQTVPLVITNSCKEILYPAINTASGTALEFQGFELQPGNTTTMMVSADWQGRVWDRSNCSFNSAGTGPATNGAGLACGTGDCNGIVDCKVTGQTPTSLAEFTLDAGDGFSYYDLSLVDGYNLPLAIVLQPNGNSSLDDIPPNLTNPSCQGTASLLAPQYYDPYTSGSQTFLGTNSSYALAFADSVTNSYVASWCPWNLQVHPQASPSNGVYSYPDGTLQRPDFNPCYSACAKWNLPQDCCTGQYNQASVCTPSQYSKAAKTVCPDAYSYGKFYITFSPNSLPILPTAKTLLMVPGAAFDDQTSTFIIPAGAGFEVVFCPGGRSTNILAVNGTTLRQLAQSSRTRRALTGA